VWDATASRVGAAVPRGGPGVAAFVKPPLAVACALWAAGSA
jgi:hypothetical protein